MIGNISISFASDISHPPTNKEIINHQSKNGEGINSDLYRSFLYDQEDINFIKKQKNIKYIIAAAYQLHPSDAVDFLMDYLPEIKNDILGLSLFISCALREDEFNKELPIEALSENLIRLSPKNGYVYYFLAYYYAKTDDIGNCSKYTKQAIKAPIFDNLWDDFSENAISTSIFLGYSKLAAQTHALGLQHDIFIYYKLADYLLNKTTNSDYLLLVLKMGTILKSNSATVLSDYMSMAIQKKSLEKLEKYQDTETGLNNIEAEKGQLKILTDYLQNIGDNYSISEKRWEQYYDDLYGKSEGFAIKKLMDEYPVGLMKADE